MSDPPSPRSTSPPLHPANLEYLRKQAKAQLHAHQRDEPQALLRMAAVFPKHHGVPSKPELGLAEAQFVLARELGYASWPRLVRHLPGDHIDQIQKRNPDMTTTQANNTSTGLAGIDQIGLSCTDLDQAQRFYCDVLGLRYGGEAPPTMKFFDCAGVNIIMFKTDKVTPGSVIYF